MSTFEVVLVAIGSSMILWAVVAVLRDIVAGGWRWPDD